MTKMKKVVLLVVVVLLIGALGAVTFAGTFTPKTDEEKVEMLDLKKEILAERVADGSMTQDEADTILTALEENIANCDGTGSKGTGRELGASFRMGGRNGNGMGNRRGGGQGGFGNGTCIAE